MGKSVSSLLVVDAFSAHQAAKVAGLSTYMVNYLCRHKVVEPSSVELRGRGRQRKYTYTDVLLLRVVAKLLKQGVSASRLRKSFAALQKRETEAAELLTSRFVGTDGYNVFFSDSGTLQLMESGQFVFAFVLELGALREDVDKGIERLRRSGIQTVSARVRMAA